MCRARSRATGVARLDTSFRSMSDACSLHFRDKWPCSPCLDVRRRRGSAPYGRYLRITPERVQALGLVQAFPSLTPTPIPGNPVVQNPGILPRQNSREAALQESLRVCSCSCGSGVSRAKP